MTGKSGPIFAVVLGASFCVWGERILCAQEVMKPLREEGRPEVAIDRRLLLEERLNAALLYNPGFAEQRDAILEAAETRSPYFRELYKKIAEARSEKDNCKLAFYALHALWASGEPAEYFLGNARNHKQQKYLAMYSIHVLSYEPDDDLQIFELDISKESGAEHAASFRAYVARYVCPEARARFEALIKR
jgi:hypothetical protein